MKKQTLERIFLSTLFVFSSFIMFAQNEVRGIVLDNKQEPLIGVNIMEKNTTNGTITDFDGHFILNLTTPSPILTISYVGYTTQEIEVNGQKDIQIVLKEDNEQLEEVVVIGYGIQFPVAGNNQRYSRSNTSCTEDIAGYVSLRPRT